MSKIIFVTGGARSGKSRFAEELAKKISDSVAYLATAEALDEEMKERISHHRERRSKNWKTIEEPIHVNLAVQNLNGSANVILLDCITLWISNLIHQNTDAAECRALDMLEAVFHKIRNSGQTLILISNEIGMGIISESPLNRQFADISGRVHQAISREADEVYFMVSGLPMKVKPC
ncbi:MAG: bifunctional adenosylcobinamide kinase/adenosylcobinamide-phosphate guanylyltransferase [Candidatus Omnitrophica bacterium]|nr:bifunctional adenosylcobinamide kinase/adenosylcobinamide-phosphate guanylyltransferase [Candidatus Omnitrophota bacterium]